LLGVALGPSIGGFIIELAGWRWMFLVNIPVGIVTVVIVHRYIPELAGRPARGGFDWLGTVLGAIMLSAFALGLTWAQRDGFGSTTVLSLLGLAALCLPAFLLVEARAQAPVLDLNLFANKPFAIGLVMNGLVFLVLGGTGLLLPFFLEFVAHYATAKVGLMMAISPVLGGVAAPFGGMLADRLGSRSVALAGLLLVALGCFSFGTVGEQLSVWGFAVRVAPMGIGMGLFNTANNSSVLNAVEREQLGIASALLSLMRTLGQTSGVPLIASIFALAALGHAGVAQHRALLGLPAESLLRGIHYAFVTAGVLVLCGFAAGAWEYARRQTSAA